MQLTQVIDWLEGPRAEQTARGVALLLGIWILYRVAGLVWELVPAPDLPPVELAPPALQAPAPAQRPRVDINQIVSWHLFGSAAAPAASISTPIDAPDTRLNLVLRGVLSSHDSENARAIIAEPNGNENFFRVGSALPGGAELKEIHPDRIILMRAGRHETLRLPRDGVEGAVVAPERSNAPGPAGEAGAVLREYRDKISDDPRALLDLARPVPFKDANGFAGFRLFPGNNPALFAQLGLQPGDLIKEVNGVPLDNPMRGTEVMQDIEDTTQLNLRVERAGQEILLTVDIP